MSNWIQTYTGRAIYFDRPPRADEIDFNDIAVALSRTCRFNGHSRVFYSVAQHSCLVALHQSDPELFLPALLHDAHEAYVGDVVTPLKNELSYAVTLRSSSGKEYTRERNPIRDLARQFDAAIGEAFGFDPALMRHRDVIEADARALATERRDLMADCPTAWKPQAEPWNETIFGLPPGQACMEFRELFATYAK
jgi:hypothetical protein